MQIYHRFFVLIDRKVEEEQFLYLVFVIIITNVSYIIQSKCTPIEEDFYEEQHRFQSCRVELNLFIFLLFYEIFE